MDSVALQLADPAQPLNRHHIGARSRWKGRAQSPKVTLPTLYHDKWHALFGNMTPYEACVFVEIVMNERTRLGWDRERILKLRISILRHTAELRQRRAVDPLEMRPTKRDRKVHFDHVPGWWRELHEQLFGQLSTVAEIHSFIYELMVPGQRVDRSGYSAVVGGSEEETRPAGRDGGVFLGGCGPFFLMT